MTYDSSNSDQDLALITQHLDALSEHFDSVQIFATRCETGELGGTVCVAKGAGNWFSRFGQVHEWMIKEDEYARQKVRKEGNE